MLLLIARARQWRSSYVSKEHARLCRVTPPQYLVAMTVSMTDRMFGSSRRLRLIRRPRQQAGAGGGRRNSDRDVGLDAGSPPPPRYGYTTRRAETEQVSVCRDAQCAAVIHHNNCHMLSLQPRSAPRPAAAARPRTDPQLRITHRTLAATEEIASPLRFLRLDAAVPMLTWKRRRLQKRSFQTRAQKRDKES